MRAWPFHHVDAFAARPFTGNPAGVIELDAWPGDELLQRLAAELNLPETAFVVRVGEADYALRWFSPKAEVALCGHATLAAAHVLMGERSALSFATRRSGVLSVVREEARYALSLPALRPEPKSLPAIVEAVGGDPIETLWHARGYAALIYAEEAEIRALAPDFARLGALGNILTVATAPGERTDIVTRAFAPGAGVDEDQVTGAAHAVIAPWWAERLGRPMLSAYQASGRGGSLFCRVEGEQVVLVGACVTVLTGSLCLDRLRT